MFVTQLVLTLYGVGVRRPFGSLESVKDFPHWLRRHRISVLVLDVFFVVFLLFMWWRLINGLDLLTFLASFFAFAVVGTLLANRIDLIRSTAASFVGVLIAFYVDLAIALAILVFALKRPERLPRSCLSIQLHGRVHGQGLP
jgi:hypothetical protein